MGEGASKEENNTNLRNNNKFGWIDWEWMDTENYAFYAMIRNDKFGGKIIRL